jgi:hypothetical protein
MTMSYNTQILALQAAGSINGDGTTPITYGCSLTRFSSGVYKLILPTGLGIIDPQSFTKVTAKGPDTTFPVVSDEADTYTKTITMFDVGGDGPTDSAIEVFVQRSTVDPF